MRSPDQDPFELVRRLSAELRRHAADLDAIFDLLPIGIGIAEDPECRDIRVNRAFAEQLGIEPRRNASLSAPPDDRPPIRIFRDGRELAADELPMQVAAREGIEVRDFDVDVVRADGRRISLFQYAAPLLDEQGRVRGALGVFVDITARRRVEQEQRFLAEASRLLTSSLDYQPTLAALAQLAVPIFGDYATVDVQRDDGTFHRVEFVVADPALQPVAEGLRGFPPVMAVDSPSAAAIRSGEVVVAQQCPDETLRRSAQSPGHLALLRRLGVTSFMMVPLRARARTRGLLTVGSVTGRHYDEGDVALFADVGARAGLALDNALLYRDAQDANQLKEDFLATLSHELRTPLNALLGWTQLLRKSDVDETARARALATIERNARAQAMLINDLLDVSRVMSGKLRLNLQSVDVPAIALAAADAVRPTVRARELELVIAVAPQGGEVMGDPDRLQQIVWNLLSNAVKFTPPGGRVDLSVTAPAGAVQIAVADTGDGIEPALLPYVFERFRQGDSSTTRAQGGLGLGLAIVRHLVDLHGGAVEAQSDGVGSGARFVVTLPARARAPVAGAVAGTGEAPLAGVRVLAADPDEDTRDVVLHAVRAAGAEVMVVASAASAASAVATFRPDVLVTAIDRDDDMDPWQPALRSDEVPAIAIRPGARTSGAAPPRFAASLVKPLEGEALVRAIAGVLRQNGARQSAR
jgi:signal transduction histidine kinase/CheY-like chemotaxis protein